MSGAAGADLACAGCGAKLAWSPERGVLACPYCRAEEAVEVDAGARAAALVERDLLAWLRRAGEAETVERLEVRCDACGAETALGPNVVADRCPFCEAPLSAAAESRRRIRPAALLPFRVPAADAERACAEWARGRWLAPEEFRRSARREGALAGVYVPAWTFDTETTTAYTGRRGEYYWVTERYTTTENGRRVTRTRRVRRTRWYPASGVVRVPFDDVLVPAGGSLPPGQAAALEPWDLGSLVPYREEYLAGFRAESYAVGLEGGWEAAQPRIRSAVEDAVRRDIGGDEQQVLSMDVRHDEVTFKHLLLPVWVGAWRHGDRVWRRVVNARTGEVQGEWPRSPVKIALLVLLALVVIAALVFLLAGTEPAA